MEDSLPEPTPRLAFSSSRALLFEGDAFQLPRMRGDLPRVQTVITSPTYWGKRQFTDDPRELGSESLEVYISRTIQLFDSLLEVIADDGSLFFVMQDSRMGSGISRTQHFSERFFRDNPGWKRKGNSRELHGNTSKVTARHEVIANTSWCGIPFRIANALVDRGRIWRDLIIWEKPNPMPDKIRNRTRQSAEFVFHFVRQKEYKFHSEAISVRGQSGRLRPMNQVWQAPPQTEQIHSATFSPMVVSRLLLATTDPGDWVLDPFVGSGTVFRVGLPLGRKIVGCDINPSFIEECRNLVQGLSRTKTILDYSPMTGSASIQPTV